jgi:DNA-binding CsgD family transcriptional regulator
MTQQLTDIERRIIIAVANGHTNKTIARDHGIHETTALRHVRKVCDRMGARDRGHLVAIAFVAGVIGPADVVPA